jgi:hypothetical protein
MSYLLATHMRFYWAFLKFRGSQANAVRKTGIDLTAERKERREENLVHFDSEHSVILSKTPPRLLDFSFQPSGLSLQVSAFRSQFHLSSLRPPPFALRPKASRVSNGWRRAVAEGFRVVSMSARPAEENQCDKIKN